MVKYVSLLTRAESSCLDTRWWSCVHRVHASQLSYIHTIPGPPHLNGLAHLVLIHLGVAADGATRSPQLDADLLADLRGARPPVMAPASRWSTVVFCGSGSVPGLSYRARYAARWWPLKLQPRKAQRMML